MTPSSEQSNEARYRAALEAIANAEIPGVSGGPHGASAEVMAFAQQALRESQSRAPTSTGLKDMPVPEDAQRRERLLADLAAEGTARCAYHWTVEAWLQGPCDCKYVPMFVGPAERLRLGEHTGCCEMRAAYRLLAEETRS